VEKMSRPKICCPTDATVQSTTPDETEPWAELGLGTQKPEHLSVAVDPPPLVMGDHPHRVGIAISGHPRDEVEGRYPPRDLTSARH
jgi:hypothetical protein